MGNRAPLNYISNQNTLKFQLFKEIPKLHKIPHKNKNFGNQQLEKQGKNNVTKEEILKALNINLEDLSQAPVFDKKSLVVKFRDGHQARFKINHRC